MSSPLVPCTGCRRHVRASESKCPFCAAALAEGHGSRAIPAATKRVTRAAVFAFASTVAACGGQTDGSTPSTTGDTGVATDTATGADTLDTGGPVAAYGGPPIDSGTVVTDSGADTLDTGGPSAAYGGPPVDSGPKDSGGPMPPYGLPPPTDAGP